MDTFLWVIVPYLCLATFVVGHFWRYRYDKFGWTTRSSQLYEDRLLRIGQPAVPLRHARRRRRPRHRAAASRSRGPRRSGCPRSIYHVVAVVGGLLAGVMARWSGMAILIYRRRTVGPVFSATTRMDKVMYAFLAVVIVLGMWNTVAGSILTVGGHYDYREGVSVWFRSFLAFQPARPS